MVKVRLKLPHSPGEDDAKKFRKRTSPMAGRPYVVGHVPRSLNSHEAEFEGLLCVNNSSTKVISFGHDGPVKQDVTRPESGLSGPSQSPPLRHTRSDISSPLFVAPREETTPCPSTPVIQTGTQLTIQGSVAEARVAGPSRSRATRAGPVNHLGRAKPSKMFQ